MKPTRRWAAALILLLFAGSAPTLASVNGSWSVGGKLTTKVSVKGQGGNRQSGAASDFYEFFGDGTFQMIDMSGTWSQDGARFTVIMSPQEIELFFEDEFAALGYNVDVTVTAARLTGKEGVGGDTIKGTFALKLSLYINDLAASGKVKATYKFEGSRAVLTGTGSTVQEQPADGGGALRDVLRDIRLGAPRVE